jgi:hypothetical protein
VRQTRPWIECDGCRREWYDFSVPQSEWGSVPRLIIRDGIDSDLVVVDPQNGKRWTGGTVNVPDDPDQDFLQRQYEAIQNLLAEVVCTGFVKRDLGESVLAEFRTPSGNQTMEIHTEQFEGGVLPRVGLSVRIVTHLLTAPDRVRDRNEPLPPLSDDYLRATPIDDHGTYRLGE